MVKFKRNLALPNTRYNCAVLVLRQMIGYYVYFQIYVHCWKSVDIKASSSKLEKFQHNLTLSNTDYNCAVLFLSQLYRLFIYASK